MLGGGSLLPAATLELGVKLCVALREAYAFDESDHGLEPDERELRPENVLLTPNGDVVAGDLGLPDFGAPPKDRPIYKAPEEFKGELRDHASDVFVLGALLYEAAMGEALFDGPSGADARFAVEHGLEGHLVLRDVERNVNARIEGLGRIVAGCLKADRDDRYEDPALVGGELAVLMGKSGLNPGSLGKRVAITPEARARSVSTPAAPPPKPNPAAAAALKRPAARSPHDPFPSAGPPRPKPKPKAPPKPPPSRPPPRRPATDPGEPEPLAPISSESIPAVRSAPPKPPSWMEEDEQDGPSVELSMEGFGRNRAAPTAPAPPPPLGEAGDRFKLQSEADPESTWNRVETVQPPPGLAQKPPGLSQKPPPPSSEGFDKTRVEKVPLRRTALSAKTKEPKEETFLGAVRWFFSRILLYAAFVATILFALAWFDVFPVATEKAATRAWNTTPLALRDALPDSVKETAVELWANKVGKGAGTGIGEVVVKVVPDDVAKSVEEVVAGADPTPTPIDAGSPTGTGKLEAVIGWVEAWEGIEAGQGLLMAEPELDGEALKDLVKVEVIGEDGAVVAEGLGGTGIPLTPGPYTARLIYSASEISGEHVGTIEGVQIHVGHRSRYRAPMTIDVGFLDTRFLMDAVDVSTKVVLSGWKPKEDRETTEPTWSGPGGPGLALPAGKWFVMATYDDGKHAPTTVDVGKVEVPPAHGRVSRKKSLQQGEQLNPTGPGVDVEVSNFGEDVSGRTEIYVYRQGADVHNDIAIAQGRGAYYFDLKPGAYDLRLVFRPSLANEDVVGEKIVNGFVVSEGSVRKGTVEMSFAYSTLDVTVTRDDADISDSVRAVVIGPDASFEGATRILDDDLGKELVLVSGSYDIYLIYEGPKGEVKKHFSMVDLKQGQLWKQTFSVNDEEWVAR